MGQWTSRHLNKCVLGASCVDFNGHRITPEDILLLLENVSALKDYPTAIKELQRVLDMVNYYHCFICMAGDKMADLHSTLVG